MPSKPAAPPRSREDSSRKAWIVSAVAHAAVVVAVLGYGLLRPAKPATTVIELVAGDPALSSAAAAAPAAPPVETPPEPVAPEPEPEAPTLAPQPKDLKQPPKPEPKKPVPAKDSLPKTAKPSATPSAPASASQPGSEGGIQIAGASGSPSGQSRWAARVKQLIHREWRPPAGIEVELPDTIAVRFKVNVETGEISDVALAKSSGNRLLDEESLRAVKRRDSVIPPKNMVPDASEEYWQVRYEFVYKGY